MPCITEYPEEENRRLSKEVSDFEAMLCGVLSVLRDRTTTPNLDLEVINMVDENESGVKVSKIFDWWEKHQEHDKKRKAVEAERKLRESMRSKALSKLTDPERKALGL